MKKEELITGSELKNLLKISYSTIARWRKLGMPHIPLLTQYRYSLSSVLAWLKEERELPSTRDLDRHNSHDKHISREKNQYPSF